MCPREGVTKSCHPAGSSLPCHDIPFPPPRLYTHGTVLCLAFPLVLACYPLHGCYPLHPCSMDPPPRSPALELRWQDAIGGGTSSHAGPCRPLSFPTNALCVWSYLHPTPTSQGRSLWLSTIEIKRRKSTLSQGAYHFHGLSFPEGAGFCLLSFPSSPGNAWHCLCFRSL